MLTLKKNKGLKLVFLDSLEKTKIVDQIKHKQAKGNNIIAHDIFIHT